MNNLKFLLFLFVIVLQNRNAAAQKITKNETDKFTKSRIIETSWEPIKIKFVNALRGRIRYINGGKYLEVSITLHDVFRVDEGDVLYLLFDDSLSEPIKCIRGGVADYNSYKGSSYWNCTALYRLDNDIIRLINNHNLTGVRITMADEYYVFDEVKLKNAEKLRKAIGLINEKI